MKILIIINSGSVNHVYTDTPVEVTIIDEDNMRVGEDFIETFQTTPLLEAEMEDYLKQISEIKV